MDDADYVQKATHNALADIASQIAIKVETNSLLHTVDVDGHSREMFEEKIRGSLTGWIEGHKLKDSYQSGTTYYVYYTLDKATYKKNAEAKRNAAIRTGMDYLSKGRDAEQMMNLVQAAQLYAHRGICHHLAAGRYPHLDGEGGEQPQGEHVGAGNGGCLGQECVRVRVGGMADQRRYP